MKYCITCKCLKPRSEFNKKRDALDGLQAKCKPCGRIRKREDYRKITTWFREYKSGLSCEDCDVSHPAILDFHHKDPTTKSYEIAGMVRTRMSIPNILNEIAKCRVLCANCHRILHWNERNDNSDQV